MSPRNAERIAEIQTLIDDIDRTLCAPEMMNDRLRFCHIVGRAMYVAHLDDSAVADRLPVSRSTVTRWRNGSAAPLPMMRKPVYAFLRRTCERWLKEFTAASEKNDDEDLDLPF